MCSCRRHVPVRPAPAGRAVGSPAVEVSPEEALAVEEEARSRFTQQLSFPFLTFQHPAVSLPSNLVYP